MKTGLPGLVVTAKEKDAVWVHYFVSGEQHEGLEGVIAPVDVVPKEQIFLLGERSS